MPDITIYGASFSPFVRKVLVIAAEKGVAAQSVPMSPRDIPADLRPHTPLGKIPFANVGGKWLADSSIIAGYVDALWPKPAIYPADPWDRARASWFEEYVDAGMIPKLGPPIVFERIVKPLFMNQPGDEAAAQNAIDTLMPPLLAYLEGELGTRGFFVGESMTIADIAIASFQVTLMHAGAEADAARYPNLRRHRDAMWARPSFAKLIEAERSMLDGVRKAKVQATG